MTTLRRLWHGVVSIKEKLSAKVVRADVLQKEEHLPLHCQYQEVS